MVYQFTAKVIYFSLFHQWIIGKISTSEVSDDQCLLMFAVCLQNFTNL